MLNVLAPRLGYEEEVTISYQTLINNRCRLGYGIVKNQGKIAEKWVCVADFTRNKGPTSILPPLRISESSMNQDRAIQLRDVDCLDVIPMVKTTGEAILLKYEALFEKVGYPSAFLQDQGGNLNSAVSLLNKKREEKNLKPIPIILDLSHFSSNLIKGVFKDKDFIKHILEKLTEINLKLRLTKYCFLGGPKSRSAGRYMGHMKKVLKWLFYLQEMSSSAGCLIYGTIKHYILSMFPDLNKTLRKLADFSQVTEVEEFLMIRLKNKGLNKKTYYSVKKKLLQLPQNHFYRIGMLEWLDTTWKIRQEMGITGSLTVSSDIIETANGCWKQLTERMPSNEITGLALVFPTFCGSYTQEEINHLICSTPLKELEKWSKEKLPITQRKLKNFNLTPDTFLSDIDQLFNLEMSDLEAA